MSSRRPHLVRYWLPPVVWMAFIFWLSTDQFSGSNTGSLLASILRGVGLSLSPGTLEILHLIVRKLAHLTGYGVLALLLYRAFRAGSDIRWRMRWAIRAFVVAASYALLDEYHQSWTRYRTGSVRDSLIDMLGSLIALVWIWISSYSRRHVRDEANERVK